MEGKEKQFLPICTRVSVFDNRKRMGITRGQKSSLSLQSKRQCFAEETSDMKIVMCYEMAIMLCE